MVEYETLFCALGCLILSVCCLNYRGREEALSFRTVLILISFLHLPPCIQASTVSYRPALGAVRQESAKTAVPASTSWSGALSATVRRVATRSLTVR